MKKIFLIILIVVVGLFILYEEEDQKEDLNTDPPIEEKEEDQSSSEEEILGKLAIIIDDLGYYPELNEKLLSIEEDLTVAILPSLRNTEKAVDDFKEIDNFEIILHMPMEPIDENQREEVMLFTDHSKEEIQDIFEDSLAQMKGEVVGVNNHKGSKFTSDSEKMRLFLEMVKLKNLFFIDSYTISTSVGYQLAKEAVIPTGRRDVFLDYVDEKEEIKNRLYEAADLALENGSAIVIGHHKENTLQVLKNELPKLKELKVKPVKVSELLK